METKQVKEIIEIFEASNLSHMELEEGNLKIRLENQQVQHKVFLFHRSCIHK